MAEMIIDVIVRRSDKEIFIQRKDLIIYLYDYLVRVPDDKTREFIEDFIKNLQNLGVAKEEKK